MVEGKNFSLALSDIAPMTNGMHSDSYRRVLLAYAAAPFQMQVFKQAGAANVDGIIIYFSGGDGHWIQESSFEGPQYTAKNFLFVNWTALDSETPGTQFYGFGQNMYSMSHGGTKFWALEVDVALNYLFNVVRVDPMFTGVFSTSTPVYLCGHSRGAGLLGYWGELQVWGPSSPYASNVKAIGCNSPAGSNSGSGAQNPYGSTRAAYGAAQKSAVPMLLTTGARDTTHLTRSEAMRINRALDTQTSVELRVVNSGTGSHWPYDSSASFFDDVVAFAGAN